MSPNPTVVIVISISQIASVGGMEGWRDEGGERIDARRRNNLVIGLREGNERELLIGTKDFF